MPFPLLAAALPYIIGSAGVVTAAGLANRGQKQAQLRNKALQKQAEQAQAKQQQEAIKQSGFKEAPSSRNPQQLSGMNALVQSGLAGLNAPMQQQDIYEGFEPIGRSLINKFQSQSIPQLAERFTELGGSETRGSSDLLGQLSGAQSEFDQGLAALMAQYGLQNRQQQVQESQFNRQHALQQLQLGLQPTKEHVYFSAPQQFPPAQPAPAQPGIGSQLLQIGGTALGSYLSGGGTFGFGQSNEPNRNKIDTAARYLTMLKKQGRI